jgi:hypothetical protein
VGIFKLASLVTNNFGQLLHVVHPDDADVIVKTVRLDEGEVDLESNVTLPLLIGDQNTERHAVWVTVEIENMYFHWSILS